MNRACPYNRPMETIRDSLLKETIRLPEQEPSADGTATPPWGAVLFADESAFAALGEALTGDAGAARFAGILQKHAAAMNEVVASFGGVAVVGADRVRLALFFLPDRAAKRALVARAAACGRAMQRKLAEYSRVEIPGRKRTYPLTLKIGLDCGALRNAAAPDGAGVTGAARDGAAESARRAGPGDVVAASKAADWLEGLTRLEALADGFAKVAASPRVHKAPRPRPLRPSRDSAPRLD